MRKYQNAQNTIIPDKYTILVVDDNPSNIGIMLNYLKDIGFNIIVARDGESAIHAARLSHPDLILLDVMMPGIDGFQTCQQMKADETIRDIPVIFSTALTDTVDIVKGFDSGGVDYITKPFQSEEVCVRINNHLALSTLRKQLESQNKKLETEIIMRQKAEDALQIANANLEQRVQERTRELESSNENLKNEILERKQAQAALAKATKKLHLLNEFVFHNIDSHLFILSGYVEIAKEINTDDNLNEYFNLQKNSLSNVSKFLNFGKTYFGLGLHLPTWQNVNLSFLYAISHFDFSKIAQNITCDDLEIFADPILEKVFINILENVKKHGISATEISITYEIRDKSVIIIIKDDGQGIQDDMKVVIFEGNQDRKTGMGLFLASEILSLTNISICERGIYGKGARFEIEVPKDGYRFISGI